MEILINHLRPLFPVTNISFGKVYKFSELNMNYVNRTGEELVTSIFFFFVGGWGRRKEGHRKRNQDTALVVGGGEGMEVSVTIAFVCSYPPGPSCSKGE